MSNWNSKNITDSSTEEFKYLDKLTNLKDKAREIYNKIDKIYIDELVNVSNNKPKEKVIDYIEKYRKQRKPKPETIEKAKEQIEKIIADNKAKLQKDYKVIVEKDVKKHHKLRGKPNRDNLAEEISDRADLRGAIRNNTFKKGLIVTKAKDKLYNTLTFL